MIVPVKEDVFGWTPPEGIDFLFEDGAHTPGFTKGVLERLRGDLALGALVLCHDVHRAQFGPHVAAEFQEVMGEGARSVPVRPSDCGLGYCRAGA